MKYSSLIRVLLLGVLLGLVQSLEVSMYSQCVLKTRIVPTKYEGIDYNKTDLKDEPLDCKLEFELKNFDMGKEFTFKWFYGEKELEKVPTVKNPEEKPKSLYSYLWKDHNRVFVELQLTRENAQPGVYKLNVSQEGKTSEATANVISAPILPTFTKPKRVLEGDSFKITCTVKAYPLPEKIEWYFAPIEINATDSDSDAVRKSYARLKPLVLRDNMTLITHPDSKVADDTIQFSVLSFENNGLYQCLAKNIYGEDQSIIFMNVKDRWAALFPFIGVIIEVTVVVVIILAYEHHQMRSKKSSSPQDGNVSSQARAAPAQGGDDSMPLKEIGNNDQEQPNETETHQRAIGK